MNKGKDLIAKAERKAAWTRTIDFIVSTWTFMLGMGGLHHDLNHAIPAISYGVACLMVFTVWALVPVDVFQITTLKEMLKAEAEEIHK